MIWPGASIAAGSFWNYVDGVNATALEKNKVRFNDMMRNRGVLACPVTANCSSCNYLDACGTPYMNNTEMFLK